MEISACGQTHRGAFTRRRAETFKKAFEIGTAPVHCGLISGVFELTVTYKGAVPN